MQCKSQVKYHYYILVIYPQYCIHEIYILLNEIDKLPYECILMPNAEECQLRTTCIIIIIIIMLVLLHRSAQCLASSCKCMWLNTVLAAVQHFIQIVVCTLHKTQDLHQTMFCRPSAEYYISYVSPFDRPKQK